MAAVGARYVDVHTHFAEYGREKGSTLLNSIDIVVVAVSDDYQSSLKTLELASTFKDRIVPCLGLHPWSVGEAADPVDEARRIVELALEKRVKCLGEVGLDTKFVPETIDKQRQVFRVFLEAARDHGLALNLHTAGTWREVYQLLVRYDIGLANFHWYTGPLDLIGAIEASGYTISVNPAVKIQKKHRAVVAAAPDNIILTESDGPYKYKGIEMSPLLVPDVIREIAAIKGYTVDLVEKIVVRNFERTWGSILRR